MPDEMGEIIQDFLEETYELIEELDEDLVKLESSANDTELLNKIFRAFHTIKGSSSFLGFNKLTALTHKLEDILNKLRKFEIKLNSNMMDTILYSVDKMKIIIDTIKKGKDSEVLDISEDIKKLDLVLSSEEESPKKEDNGAWSVHEMVELQKQEVETEDKNISKAKAGKKTEEEIDAEIERLLKQRMGEDKKRREKQKTEAHLHEDIANEKNIVESHVNNEQSIRVDVNKLDDLMNLVGELVLAKNRLNSITEKIGDHFKGGELAEEASSVASQVALITTDLQMAVMRTRMVAVGKVFNKFPRVVRDIAKELKKEVNLVIEGAETELDKNVVDEINDPLVHLIRNSIDHGIETPDERLKNGKSKKGQVRLSAFHEGNYIVIDVEDDGSGMDVDAIRQKAVDEAIISQTEAGQMGTNETLALIFTPGFSMSDHVSDISGRGVGMDVVRTNIEKLNGIVDIKTQRGKGTKITLRIPLTLAIIQALLVKVVNETFAIPLFSVMETVRITSDDIKKVENRDILNLRGSIISLTYLGDALGISPGTRTLNEKELYAVIVAMAEKRMGLVVDKLIGREEIVIKSLGTYLSNVKSISGATIMGDGSITPILDINTIVRETSLIKSRIKDHFVDIQALKNQKPLAFVISNNETMKHRLVKVLGEKEYEVKYARSLKDGFNLALHNVAQLIFVDLEMAVGSGYDFAKQLRELAFYKNTAFVGIAPDGLFDNDKIADAKFIGVLSLEFGVSEVEAVLKKIKKLKRRVA